MGLDKRDHGSLSLWATDCVEHVLPCFEEKHPKDDRPRNAVEAFDGGGALLPVGPGGLHPARRVGGPVSGAVGARLVRLHDV